MLPIIPSSASGLLRGKRLLIVGGGRAETERDDLMSNGRGIALVAAAEGALVAIADPDAAAANRMAEEITRGRGRSDAVSVPLDVVNPAAAGRCIDAAREAWGGLDGLVLNLATAAGFGLSASDASSWDQVFALNVRTQMLIAQSALGALEPGGSIVLMSSISAMRPVSGCPSYDASKAALAALCRSIALEGEPKRIRANLAVLGFVDTPQTRLLSQANPARSNIRLPFGRQATAVEVGRAVAFLISDWASYVNAQALVIDGGYSALH